MATVSSLVATSGPRAMSRQRLPWATRTSSPGPAPRPSNYLRNRHDLASPMWGCSRAVTWGGQHLLVADKADPGGGTRAASFSISSCGANTTCVVPSSQAGARPLPRIHSPFAFHHRTRQQCRTEVLQGQRVCHDKRCFVACVTPATDAHDDATGSRVNSQPALNRFAP